MFHYLILGHVIVRYGLFVLTIILCSSYYMMLYDLYCAVRSRHGQSHVDGLEAWVPPPEALSAFGPWHG